ncbi:glutamine synthetase family protein [Amaricoccus tamworthensis]|uniref:glutamine synthetase family protein n=1 Tax=Amaricoccus tamworthensis TaxID=57002 RepID=UPI003C7C68B8
MSGDDIAAFMAEHPQLRSVTVAVCDVNGAFRGKRLPLAQIEKIADGGFRMPLSAVTLDIWGRDIEGSALVFASGDADGVCSMTGRGVLLSTWLSEPTAMIPVWMNREDGSPFPIDPRRALAMVLDRYAAKGLRPVVATELEFYLTEPGGERPRRPKSPMTGERLHSDEILSVSELDGFSAFLDDVYAACAIQDIPVDSAISEGGAGQFEINLLHTDDPLKAADDSVLFKRLVRGVARKHGFAATFMAKPFGDGAGNGMHVHFSVLDRDGNNIFDNGGPEGSQALLHAVGGLLATMHENTLVFAPHQNSYRRISPGSHAPTGASWGYENRTAAIRIPGGDNKARRIEHRLAGADVNPYLSMAAILGGALLGMEQEIEPLEPLTGNAYEAEIPSLPLDWPSAIAAFEEGEYASQIFDPKLQQLFAQTKQQELKRFSETVTRFEYQTYLEVV